MSDLSAIKNKIEFFLLAVLSLLIIGCSHSSKTIVDKKLGKEILIGECNRNSFNQDKFENWFYNEYDRYIPKAEFLKKIEGELYNFDITIVFGSWCKDSKREVPRFFKILDYLAYHEPKIKMIAVDGYKKSDVIDVKEMNIKFVPTFIIYKDKKEIGRIIEEPKTSLENELVKIILPYINLTNLR